LERISIRRSEASEDADVVCCEMMEAVVGGHDPKEKKARVDLSLGPSLVARKHNNNNCYLAAAS